MRCDDRKCVSYQLRFLYLAVNFHLKLKEKMLTEKESIADFYSIIYFLLPLWVKCVIKFEKDQREYPK